MTLKYFIIRLKDAWCRTATDVYRWLELNELTKKEVIDLKSEIEHADKVDELWDIYSSLTMYLKHSKDS